MLLLALLACERDPTLTGYWEVVAMRAGASEDALEEVTRAGFMEFVSTGELYAMSSYLWRDGWTPDPRPDLRVYATDAGATGDFVEGYREEGETFSVTFEAGAGAPAPVTFALDDWEGSSVTLSSAAAFPPGETAQTYVLEYDLER
jgi:hypothetical protein